MDKLYYMGIDVGSTTVKLYVEDQEHQCIYSKYQRHYSDVKPAIESLIKEVQEHHGNLPVKVVMTGSGGLSLSKHLNVEFVQEVIACTKTVETYIPECDVAIELGGEDAKITYFESTLEQRMNGTCAGGTGAFIDQMASLLQTDAAGLNELAKNYETIYPIASRCGVFAKTDIQPLINEGAAREDIAISIFQAVVNQTISGLACGKPIRGKVAFLGGPLYFLDQLRTRFIESLNLKDEDVIFPQNSQLFVAMGACLLAREDKIKQTSIDELVNILDSLKDGISDETDTLKPLFETEEDRIEFRNRHYRTKVKKRDLNTYQGKAFLGVDVGSTTSKAVLVDEDGSVLYTFYSSNEGNPIEVVRKILKEIYEILPKGVELVHAGSTGYGEALIKSAFKMDVSEVETISHFTAAKYFKDDVSFILDIGGQDMKAIKIEDGIIQDILLNEACSSGCGSFIETFAKSLGYNVADFANLALQSTAPIDLGSRCTVFMNSKVKQAQKEGAKIEDISAGLAYSVIKNALYKVIKLRSPESIGKSVLVQGGTFYNESVLRAFEQETGIKAIRPDIAGLMGAFGIALIARERYQGQGTTLLNKEQVDAFGYESTIRYCQKCTNHCMLTVSSFNDGSEHISGNRCERGANLPPKSKQLPNLYDYKYRRVFNYRSLTAKEAKRGTVGIPRVLNMYENYPFWHTLFTDLKFRVVLSPRSSKKIYEKGIESIPSESVCYPAKLSHGHIESLIEKGIKYIFYPSVAYERKENVTQGNHYNCPVVTSYPEVIRNNVDNLETNEIIFRNPFMDLSNRKTMFTNLKDEFKSFGISDKELKAAIEHAYEELQQCRLDIQGEGETVLAYLKENNIDYCTDETNLEDHYTRNRLRNHVIPYLEREINPRAVSHMADTMEQMRTVWAFMEEEVEKCRKYCVKPKQDKADGVVILEEGFRSVNETVRTFLIHELLCETAGRKKDIEQIHVKLVEELMEHQTGRKIMLPYEMTGERCYEGIWLHKVKDKEKSGENSKPPVQMRILERTPQTSVFPKKTYTKWFDYDIIKSTVKIRHKQPGDYITIDKNGSTQSLKKYFVNVKVPREDREKIWLAADGSHILWIIGYRQNQAYQITDKTRRILEIEFNGGEEDGRESKSISS